MQVRKAGLDGSVEHAGELMAAQRDVVPADGDIRTDIVRRVEGYTGDVGCWDVRVSEGVATVRRAWGAPQISRAVKEFALERLARTVPGVVAVHILPSSPVTGPATGPAAAAQSARREAGTVRRGTDGGTEAT